MQTGDKQSFSKEVAEKETRMLRAQKIHKRSIWSGMGLFGMIGWSVVVPSLLGAALGKWLDKKWPAHFSWTLALLLAGLTAGCWIAWNWVAKENTEMHKTKEDKNG